jgi:hypothetical protein
LVVTLIGSDESHAESMLDSIKTEFETNERLVEDFPEAVYPIRCLEGIANRCAGQTYRGDRTHIGWTAREIVMPTVAGSPASGAVIRVAGLTGRIRGMKFKRADGQTERSSNLLSALARRKERAGDGAAVNRQVREGQRKSRTPNGPKKGASTLRQPTHLRVGPQPRAVVAERAYAGVLIPESRKHHVHAGHHNVPPHECAANRISTSLGTLTPGEPILAGLLHPPRYSGFDLGGNDLACLV